MGKTASKIFEIYDLKDLLFAKNVDATIINQNTHYSCTRLYIHIKLFVSIRSLWLLLVWITCLYFGFDVVNRSLWLT